MLLILLITTSLSTWTTYMAFCVLEKRVWKLPSFLGIWILAVYTNYAALPVLYEFQEVKHLLVSFFGWSVLISLLGVTLGWRLSKRRKAPRK